MKTLDCKSPIVRRPIVADFCVLLCDSGCAKVKPYTRCACAVPHFLASSSTLRIDVRCFRLLDRPSGLARLWPGVHARARCYGVEFVRALRLCAVAARDAFGAAMELCRSRLAQYRQRNRLPDGRGAYPAGDSPHRQPGLVHRCGVPHGAGDHGDWLHARSRLAWRLADRQWYHRRVGVHCRGRAVGQCNALKARDGVDHHRNLFCGWRRRFFALRCRAAGVARGGRAIGLAARVGVDGLDWVGNVLRLWVGGVADC